MDIEADIAEFHTLIGQPGPGNPSLEQRERADLRRRLIVGEVRELLAAIGDDDLVAIADGCADVMYAVAGTAHTYGIPLAQVWDEVHRSNMTKQAGPTGKAVKGAGYRPPDIAGVFGRVAAQAGRASAGCVARSYHGFSRGEEVNR